MDTGGFSDYRANKWLTTFTTVWIGLHYTDPSISGAYASEVFGGSYGRKKVNFTDPDARVIFNEEGVVFRGLPTVKISHIGGWDTQYNGNLEFVVPLAVPVTVLAGKRFEIGASQLAISLP